MISRMCLKCKVCGARTVTRTALTDLPYQEFAFPCPGCAVEIRFGMEIHAPDWKYTKLLNAEWLDSDKDVTNVEVFDSDHLIPLPKDMYFSPFLATMMLLGGKRMIRFNEHQAMRRAAVEGFWPRLERLDLHFTREQWDLFDKQYAELNKAERAFSSTTERLHALCEAFGQYSRFFRAPDDTPYRLIGGRIALATRTSRAAATDLAQYFSNAGKNVELCDQLQDIRRRWAATYLAIAPIYVSRYWDAKQHQLADYTLAQKRFDELKTTYVDCFETLCRITVIAGGIEGIIETKSPCVPTPKGILTIGQFDVMRNGSKPDVLRALKIAELFVPFMDHRLRNGIGHHAAHYDVVGDKVDYAIENEKGIQSFSIPYILFCDKLVDIYGQLELASLYVNWLRLSASEVL